MANPYEEYKHYERNKNQFEHKSLIWQSYKGCAMNRWSQISKEDLERDINKTPKIYNGVFYYIVKENRDFIIAHEFARLIFYNHIERYFMYGTKDRQLIPESMVYKSYEEAQEELRKELKKNEGKTYISAMPTQTIF